MVKGILGGIIAVILIGIAAFLWNSLSDGGLVYRPRFLGHRIEAYAA
jgi:hypothetical protein